MNCPLCGAEYLQAGNPDDGYVRSICFCEREQKCRKCKRGDFHPVNQALLDLCYDTKHYACSRHGHLEAESFPLPEKPVKASKRAPVPTPSPAPAPVVAAPAPVFAWPDTSTLDGMRASLNKSRQLVMCLDCGVEQKFRDFDVRPGMFNLPVPYCPLCHEGRPKFSGKNW